MNARQAAEFLGIKKHFLYTQSGRGSESCVPHIKIGRFLRFDRAVLERWLLEQSKGGTTPPPWLQGGD